MSGYRQAPKELRPRTTRAEVRLVGPSGIYSVLRPDVMGLIFFILVHSFALIGYFSGKWVWYWRERVGPLAVLDGLLGILLSSVVVFLLLWLTIAVSGKYTEPFEKVRGREELALGTGLLWAGFLGPRAQVTGEGWWFRHVACFSRSRSAHAIQGPTRFEGSARLLLPADAIDKGSPKSGLENRFRTGAAGHRLLLVHAGVVHLIWLDSDPPPVSTLQAWLQALTVTLEVAAALRPGCTQVEETIRRVHASLKSGEPERFSLARFRKLERELETLAAINLPEVSLGTKKGKRS